MSERLPVPARGTEPARATVVGSVFDLHGLRCGPDPATATADEGEMQVAGSRPNPAPPPLPMQEELPGRRRHAGAPADDGKLLPGGGGARARGPQPVLELPAVDPAFAQALELVQAQLPIASHDAPAVVPAQGGEEVGGTVEPIAQDER